MTWLAELGRTLAFAAFHLGGAGIVAVSAWVFGEAVLGRRLTGVPGLERWAVTSVLGLGLIAQGMLVLGLFGFFQRLTVLGALAVAHLLCWRTWSSVLASWRRLGRRIPGRTAALWTAGAVAVLGPAAALALYPTTGFDATVYHLPYVEAFLSAERLVFVPELRFPVFPQVVEMGFVLAFCLSGEAAAQLTQVLSAALGTALVLSWGTRVWGRRVGLWAAALWLGTPLVVWISSSAYVDVGFTAFVTAAFAAWDRWRRGDGRFWLALAGADVGFAAGVKYLGLFFLAALFALAAARTLRIRRAAALLVFLGLFAAAAGPWYLRVLSHTGNPVFPFYSSVFGASEWTPKHDQALPKAVADPGLDEALETAASQAARVREGISFLVLAPWNAVMNRRVFHFQAPLTPFYLLLAPLALPFALRRSGARTLLGVTLAYGLFWLTTVRDLRFLLAVLPLSNLALAAGLDDLWRRLPRLGHRYAAALAVVLVLPGPLYGFYKLAGRGLLPADEAARVVYLGERVPGFTAVHWMNEELGSDYTVYALHGERLRYYADGRFLGDWFGPYRYAKVGPLLGRNRDLHDVLSRFGAGYFLLPRRDAVRLAADEGFRTLFELLPAGDEGFILYRLRDTPGP